MSTDGTVLISTSQDMTTGFRDSRYAFDEIEDIVKTASHYSATLFKGGYRNGENAMPGQELVILDFDSELTLQYAKALFSDYLALIATTRHHQKEKVTESGTVHPPCDRFRVLIPTTEPICLELEAFRRMMAEVMLDYPQADETCKNIDRMYFGYVDAETFWTDGMKLFDWKYYHKRAKERKQLQQRQKKPYRTHFQQQQNNGRYDNRSRAEAIIQQIEREGTDITGSYGEWLRVGFAFAHEFREHGREYFHRVSRFYPGYNQEETDRQFTRCLREHNRDNPTTIATFFSIAGDYGFRYMA